MEKHIFSVTELNERIKGLLELDPLLADICIAGELSNYKVYPSGHHYFTLKDSESSLRCVMFKSSAVRLRFRPENGMSVTVTGRVAVYPRDGAYQLYCTGIMPLGTGDLQIAFEQLKAKLDAEGLFESGHKKPLPEFPETIAVITSSAGAAVHDIMRILAHRWPLSKVVVMPVRVQGEEAPAEIAGAIRYANKYRTADLIITGRGGGSMEDLWAFNDERVARAIYDSEIPVISAVGHEPDVTISDYVADRRASTPSNAAEIAVPDMNDMISALSGLSVRAEQAMGKKLMQLSQRLDALKKTRALTNPLSFTEPAHNRLDILTERLGVGLERSISSKEQELVRLAAALDAMSPLRVLSRGYAIASNEKGTNVRSVKQLTENETVSLRLVDGTADCRVEKISAVKNKE